jgi:myo-inositol-1(or 4)-monophosphatase
VTTPADLLRAAGDALDVARARIRQRLVGSIRAKTDRDFVSDLDVAVERDVRRLLADRVPDIGFLGEEEGWSPGSNRGRYWVLDPIDGTTNLVKALPLCVTSLALVDGDHAVLGMIDAPFLDLRYHALAGQGAFHAGGRLRAATTSRLDEAVVALGDYAVGLEAENRNRLRLAITAQLAANVQRVRMFGTAALDLAWVAEGRLDASITLSNKPWDTAAGVLLAREAGARVVDQTGAPHSVDSPATIAAPAPLLDDLLALIRRATGEQGDTAAESRR